MPVPGPLRQPSNHCLQDACHAMSSTGLGSLSTDLPAHSLGRRSQEGGLVTPASPSQSRSQRGMIHGYLPPASPRQEGGVDREGEKGRGARLKEGMGMWRPRAGAQGGLPPAMFDAYGCPSLSTQTPSRPGGLRCPRSQESRTSKVFPRRGGWPRAWKAPRRAPSAERERPHLALWPEVEQQQGEGSLSPVQPGQWAPLRPSPGGCPPDPSLLPTAPRWASKTWVPRSVSSQHWRDQLYLGGAGAVPPPQN